MTPSKRVFAALVVAFAAPAPAFAALTAVIGGDDGKPAAIRVTALAPVPAPVVPPKAATNSQVRVVCVVPDGGGTLTYNGIPATTLDGWCDWGDGSRSYRLGGASKLGSRSHVYSRGGTFTNVFFGVTGVTMAGASATSPWVRVSTNGVTVATGVSEITTQPTTPTTIGAYSTSTLDGVYLTVGALTAAPASTAFTATTNFSFAVTSIPWTGAFTLWGCAWAQVVNWDCPGVTGFAEGYSWQGKIQTFGNVDSVTQQYLQNNQPFAGCSALHRVGPYEGVMRFPILTEFGGASCVTSLTSLRALDLPALTTIRGLSWSLYAVAGKWTPALNRYVFHMRFGAVTGASGFTTTWKNITGYNSAGQGGSGFIGAWLINRARADFLALRSDYATSAGLNATEAIFTDADITSRCIFNDDAEWAEWNAWFDAGCPEDETPTFPLPNR